MYQKVLKCKLGKIGLASKKGYCTYTPGTIDSDYRRVSNIDQFREDIFAVENGLECTNNSMSGNFG